MDTHRDPDDVPIYAFGDCVLDTGQRLLQQNGRRLGIPGKTYDLLAALLERAPNVVSYAELIDRVWEGRPTTPETISQRLKLLREVLGDDAHNPRYVRVVRGEGCQMIPEVHSAVADPSTGRNWRWPAVIGAVLAIVAGVIALLFLERSPSKGPDFDPPSGSIAVLPYRFLGINAEDEFVADGVADTILNKMSNANALKVIARDSSFSFKESGYDLATVARRLNVRYLLEGSVQVDGNGVRITSHLVDTVTLEHVWSMSHDASMADVFAMEDEVAGAVFDALSITLAADQRERLTAYGTTNIAAYLEYLQGQYALLARGVAHRAAATHFSNAIALDPQYANAHLALARAYRVAYVKRLMPAHEAEPKVIGAITAALVIDPELAEAHALLADFYMDLGKHAEMADEIAERTQQAVALAPESPLPLATLGRWMCEAPEPSLRRCREGIALSEQALRLDPENSRLYLRVAQRLLSIADRGAATGYLMESIRRNPELVPGYGLLGWLNMTSGRFARAAGCFRELADLRPGTARPEANLAQIYIDVGELGAARALIEQIPKARLNVATNYALPRIMLLAREGAIQAAAQRAVESDHRIAADLILARRLTFGVVRDQALADGEIDQAIAFLERRVSELDGAGDKDSPLGIRAVAAAAPLSDLYAAKGAHDEARSWLHAAEGVFDRDARGDLPVDQLTEDARLTILPLIKLRLGKVDEATQLLDLQLKHGYLQQWWYTLKDPSMVRHGADLGVGGYVRSLEAAAGEQRRRFLSYGGSFPPCAL